MNYLENFQKWLNYFSKYEKDKDTLKELNRIAEDKNELLERFSSNLTFGTAGLRGLMGIGTNRLNIYTVRKATQGLANYLNKKNLSSSVVISFDSRINSNSFAKESASVLAANGIKTYITKELTPTPLLSFLVKHLSCNAGIMITASHNPAEYNGYKCYEDSGAQMSLDHTSEVYKYIDNIDIFNDVKFSEFDKEVHLNNIEFVSNDSINTYIKNVLSQSINKEYPSMCKLNVTYTPLNGAGKHFVEKVLNKSGVNHLHIVEEQASPNGNFPTCKYPNPETKEAFTLALDYARKYSSDIILATDPDSDRLGVGILHNKEYILLSGNQIGVLLFHYILSQKKKKNLLPKTPLAVRTIVSSSMVDAIAREYNCNIICVPTGFKYIGEKISELENKHSIESFIFGFEESNGYLSGTYTRDKDAVSTAMLICEMASFYKNQGVTLIDILGELNNKYGFYNEKTLSFEFKGTNGSKTIEKIMDRFKEAEITCLGKTSILYIKNYIKSEILEIKTNKKSPLNFYKLNIVELNLENGISVIIRPSGTEPKLKIYIMVKGATLDETTFYTNIIEQDLQSKIKELS